ncbi:MAG: hypothetical protein C0601_09515 [Candidatus Muiribacterium halophilum]|uniref:Porin domain-containing protein n=1 Tax=Muiribacterium halophilum TaxID=2053465 RepID=A0A2N5ZDK8_MUIH1|nr:MAG: hypothetical protein C0601_09515 [Candidatus Muirbacterium halophilum]
MKKLTIITLLVISVMVFATTPEMDFFGFIKLDMSFDSAQNTNGNQTYYVDNNAAGDIEEFNMTANQTRLGFNTKQELNNGVLIKGYYATDFYGGGAQIKANPRMRKAYVKVIDNKKTFIFGQHGDIFATMSPYGIDGSANLYVNVGYRRPMVAFQNETNGGVFTFALARPWSADANSETWNPEVNSPDFQFNYKLNSGISIGGYFGNRYEDIAGVRGVKVDSNAFVLDYHKKSSDKEMKCEVFTGEAMSGYYGGIGYDVKGSNAVECTGGWFNYIKTLDNSSKISFAIGTQENDDQYLAAGDRMKNEFASIIHCSKINEVISFDKGIAYHNTEYKTATSSVDYDDMRIMLSLKYAF